MNYSPEQFLRLNVAVEDDGGMLTDELCSARTYELTGPKGKRPDGSHRPLILPGCGNVSIFEVPISGGEPIKLCAVCDDLGNTPRYRHQVLG